jgi:hypothetical protein
VRSRRAGIATGVAALAIALSFGAVATAPQTDAAKQRGKGKAKGKPKPKPNNFAPRTVLRIVDIISERKNASAAVLMATRPSRPPCMKNRLIEIHAFGATGDRVVTTFFALRPAGGKHVLLSVGFIPMQGDAAFYLYAPAKQAGRYFCASAQTAVVPLPVGAGT